MAQILFGDSHSTGSYVPGSYDSLITERFAGDVGGLRDGRSYRPGALEHIFWCAVDAYNAGVDAGTEVGERIGYAEGKRLLRDVNIGLAYDLTQGEHRGKSPETVFCLRMNRIVGEGRMHRSRGNRLFGEYGENNGDDGVSYSVRDRDGRVAGHSPAREYLRSYSRDESRHYMMEHIFYRMIDEHNERCNVDDPNKAKPDGMVMASEARRLHDEVFANYLSGHGDINEIFARMNRIVGPRLGYAPEGEGAFFDGVMRDDGYIDYTAGGTRGRDFILRYSRLVGLSMARERGEERANSFAADRILLSPFDLRVRDRSMFFENPRLGVRQVSLEAAAGVATSSVVTHESVIGEQMSAAMAAGVSSVEDYLETDGAPALGTNVGRLLSVDDVSTLSAIRRFVPREDYERVAGPVRETWQSWLTRANDVAENRVAYEAMYGDAAMRVSSEHFFSMLGRIATSDERGQLRERNTAKVGLVLGDAGDGAGASGRRSRALFDPAAHLSEMPFRARQNYFQHLEVVQERAAALVADLRASGHDLEFVNRGRAGGAADQVVAKVNDRNVDVRLVDGPEDINYVGRTYDISTSTSRYVAVERKATRDVSSSQFDTAVSVRDGFRVDAADQVKAMRYALGHREFVDASRMNPRYVESESVERESVGSYRDGFIDKTGQAIFSNGQTYRYGETNPTNLGPSRGKSSSSFIASLRDGRSMSYVDLGQVSMTIDPTKRPEPYMVCIHGETVGRLERENFFTRPSDDYAYRYVATAVSTARERFAEMVDIERVIELARMKADKIEARYRELDGVELSVEEEREMRDFTPQTVLSAFEDAGANGSSVYDELRHPANRPLGDIQRNYFAYLVDMMLYQDGLADDAIARFYPAPRFALATGMNMSTADAAFSDDAYLSPEMAAVTLASRLGYDLDAIESGEAAMSVADVLAFDPAAFVRQDLESLLDDYVGYIEDREGNRVSYERDDAGIARRSAVDGYLARDTYSTQDGLLRVEDGVDRDAMDAHGDDVVHMSPVVVSRHMASAGDFGANRQNLINAIVCMDDGVDGGHRDLIMQSDMIDTPEHYDDATRRFFDSTIRFGEGMVFNPETGERDKPNETYTWLDLLRMRDMGEGEAPFDATTREYLLQAMNVVGWALRDNLCDLAYIGDDPWTKGEPTNPDISVDLNGVIQWRGRRRGQDAPNARSKFGRMITGVIGQVFTPDENGLYHTSYAFSDNQILAIGKQAHMLDHVENAGSRGERLRVRTFAQELSEQIRMQIRRDVIYTNITGGIGDATSLNGIYRNADVVTRFALDDKAKEMARAVEPGLDGKEREDAEAAFSELYDKRVRARQDTIVFCGANFSEEASVSEESRRIQLGDKHQLKSADISYDGWSLAGGSTSMVDADFARYCDAATMGMARTQGTKVQLGAHTTINEDGSLTPGGDGEARSALREDPLFDYQEYNAWNRQQMAGQNVLTSLPTRPVGFAQFTCGYTNDDGIVISKEFAESHLVPDGDEVDEDGNPRLRPLAKGDKLSDLSGNKGVVGCIVDCNVEPDAELRPVDHKLWEIFSANRGDDGRPRLDAVMSPHSALSRHNGGTARDTMSREVFDLKGPGFGEEHVDAVGRTYVSGKGCLGQVPLLIQDKFADHKTALDANRHRNAGWQWFAAMAANGATEIMDMAYADNDRGMESVREALRSALGFDVDANGQLHPELIVRADEEGSVPVFDAVDLSRYGSDAKHVKATTDFSDWMARQGGYVEVPFELKWPEHTLSVPNEVATMADGLAGHEVNTPYKGREDHTLIVGGQSVPQTDAGTWHMPVMSPGQRVGSRSVDGAFVNHDYTKSYVKIVEQAAEWSRLQQGIDDGAEGAALKKLKDAQVRCERTAQREFSHIANEVFDREVAGKANAFKSDILCSEINGDARTSIWSPDPNLPLDTVLMGEELAGLLRLEKDADGSFVPDQTVVVWRDPVLEQGNIRAMKVRVQTAADDAAYGGHLYGIAINPELGPIFSGDFDGDTVAVLAPHRRSTIRQAADRLAVEREFVNSHDIDQKVRVGRAVETRGGMAAHPEIAERIEADQRAIQEVYADGDWRGEGYPERISSELTASLSKSITDMAAAEVGRNAIAYDSVGSHLESVWRSHIESGAKGNMGGLVGYAQYFGVYSEGNEDMRCDVSETEDGVAYIDSSRLVDAGHTLATQDQVENVEKAVAIKTERTGEVGKIMQYMLLGLDDFETALVLAKPPYQMVLDMKNNGEEAMEYICSVPPLRDLFRTGQVYEDLSGGTRADQFVPVRRRDDAGGKRNPATGRPLFTVDECVECAEAILRSVSMEGTINPSYIRNAFVALSDEDGNVVGIDAKAKEHASVLRRAAFEENGVAVAIGCLRGQTLFNESDVNLCAPSSVRAAFAKGAEFEAGHAYVAQSVRSVEVENAIENEHDEVVVSVDAPAADAGKTVDADVDVHRDDVAIVPDEVVEQLADACDREAKTAVKDSAAVEAGPIASAPQIPAHTNTEPIVRGTDVGADASASTNYGDLGEE